MELHLAPAALCALIGLADGACVPWLISLLPEPDDPPSPDQPDEAAHPGTEATGTKDAKEPYAEVAALPGLAWKCALATALANTVMGGALGWDWRLLYLVPLAPVLVALSVVDWRTRMLPLRIVWPATFATAGLLVVVWAVSGGPTDDLVRAALGFGVGFGSFALLWFVHPRGLGFGDVRLGGLLGLALGYLGWGPLLVGLYAGFLLGGVGGGLLALLRVVERRSFPFGPFLVLGALVGVLFGGPVADLWAR